jgi:putative PIN family toxin of toxin-antitoxin system
VGEKEKAAIRIVLDTNILVSALLFKGELAGIVDLWKKGKIVPLLSRETFEEFRAVLEYPKFSLTAHEVKVIIEEEVLPFFEVIEAADTLNTVCRDPEDDKFIACAMAVSAKLLVSGDKDLLAIGKYKSVKIINPSALLKMF